MATKIEWTDVTVNPFPGCRKVSPGCQNCYAERMAQRLRAMGKWKYARVVDDNGWTGQVSTDRAAMYVGGKGKKIFVNSMGDLFYEGITDEQRNWAFDKMLSQPQHTFQILTKRPERAAEYYAGVAKTQGECSEPNPLAYAPNIWFGWTAEDQQRFDERTPWGVQIQAAVRFVSLEPLLGPMNLTGNDERLVWPWCEACGKGEGVEWVIVGCESGPKRRPCDKEWVADIVPQCHAAAVPVFVKQINVAGRIVKDPEDIALELTSFFDGGPLNTRGIRQFPNQR